nr:hypothetical protein FVER53263_12305 [Fusarium verticillioides]
MPFNKQQNLSNFVTGIGLYDHSSPAVVTFQGKLFVFYVGKGDDGIFYTSMKDWKWERIQHISDRNIGVANNTSPSAVAFEGKLYIFFNGKGNDGTFYTIFDGSSWSKLHSVSIEVGGMGFLPGTSPNAAVDQDAIQLFWSGAGDDGIFYARFDGDKWGLVGHIDTVGIAPGTSPCAVFFNKKLHVFWSGRGGNETWYCTREDGGWSQQHSVSAQIGGQGYYPGTNPTAIVEDDKHLRLFWVGSGGPDQGLWYSDHKLNPYSWTGQRNLGNEIGGQHLKKMSSACGLKYDKTIYVFWEGPDQEIWLTYQLSD